MLVTTPIVGRAIAHNAAMSPGSRAPISSTSASVSRGAPRSVIGTPISALKFPGVAWTRNVVRSAAAVRSFVLVLPVEPVMPTTRASGSCARAQRPMAASASSASVTWITAPRVAPAGDDRLRDERDRRAGRERVLDEIVAVARGVERDEARSGLERSRVVGERRRARVARAGDQRPTGRGRDLGGGQLHPSAPELVARDLPVVERERAAPDRLAGLGPLAGDHDHVPGAGGAERVADRGAAVEFDHDVGAARRGARGAPRRRSPADPPTVGCPT